MGYARIGHVRTSCCSLVVVHFWAPWSQPCKQMNDVMSELAGEHPGVRFIKVGRQDRGGESECVGV